MRHPTRQDITVRNLRAMQRKVAKLEGVAKLQGTATREAIRSLIVVAKKVEELQAVVKSLQKERW